MDLKITELYRIELDRQELSRQNNFHGNTAAYLVK